MSYGPENPSSLRLLGLAATAAGSLLLAGCGPNHYLSTDEIVALSPEARVDYDFAGGNPAGGSGNEEGYGNYYNAHCLANGPFDPFSRPGYVKPDVSVKDGVITVTRNAYSDTLPGELHFKDEGADRTLTASDDVTAQMIAKCKMGSYITK